MQFSNLLGGMLRLVSQPRPSHFARSLYETCSPVPFSQLPWLYHIFPSPQHRILAPHLSTACFLDLAFAEDI